MPMPWYWLLLYFFFCIHCTVLLINFYQIVTLWGLELDNLNPFEGTAKINKWILPEVILQGLLCILFLLSGHWVMFLVTFPVTLYHVKWILKREHLIDVTEVFRNLNFEKDYRLFKLAMYLLLLIIFAFRFVSMVLHSVRDGNDDNLLS